MVKLSDLKPGIERTFEIKEAIIVYLDILGFSEKADEGEIEACLVDFPGPLVIASMDHLNVRCKVFSDNTIVAADVKHVKELMEFIEVAFDRMSADGVLVRGGIALGSYYEFETAATKIATPNFQAILVAGSGVVKAVKLEASKPAALLFTDEECAVFLTSKCNIPIFDVDGYKVVAWSRDKIIYTGSQVYH